ncbi:COesterase domain containing protein, partial [Asbolus verrucosus]
MQVEDEANRTEIGRLIREIYTGGEPLIDHFGDGIRYYSDNGFTRAVVKHAELYSKVAETYFYQFSYNGELGGNDVHYDGAEYVGHAEELRYIFCSDNRCDFTNYPEADQITSERLLSIWTNFAKYQNPTPEPSELLQNITWPLVSTENGDYLYVDINENLEIKNHPKEETYARWTELYDNLGFTDFDTCNNKRQNILRFRENSICNPFNWRTTIQSTFTNCKLEWYSQHYFYRPIWICWYRWICRSKIKQIEQNWGIQLEMYIREANLSLTNSELELELYSKVAKAYFYQFSYDGELGGNDIRDNGVEYVGHAEEYFYIFCSGVRCNFTNYPSRDQVTSERLVSI